MNESTNPATPTNAQQQAELDLLHAVLSPAPSHPWDSYSQTTAAYLNQLEHNAVELVDDADIESQWSQVSALAASLWAGADTPLLAALTQKFGTRMPPSLLAQLASQAQSAANSGQALIDQLVTSAQAALTGWDVGDLQVMARPMALAMRSHDADPVEAVVQSIRPADWEALSEIEQARLSLAIARYALAELADDD